MPTYQIYVNKGRLSSEEKKKVASAITDGHISQTGAPRYYVQVIINETEDENRFIAGRNNDKVLWIYGDVRTRPAEQNAALMNELVQRTSEVCNYEKDMIWCDLNGIEPQNIMKFLTVFPPAGEEQRWHDSLPDETKDAIKRMQE